MELLTVEVSEKEEQKSRAYVMGAKRGWFNDVKNYLSYREDGGKGKQRLK